MDNAEFLSISVTAMATFLVGQRQRCQVVLCTTVYYMRDDDEEMQNR